MSGAHPPYVTVTHGGRGFFAVLLVWNKDGEHYEPWNSSPFASQRRDEAVEDGKCWAEAEAVEFRT